ncbi:hypothetical protein CBR_g46624 [Chara braunii]|uniref:Uncharacterized protein n=1 Tax=Chara braunii TaxID=69332 RepID=A0A388M0U6_CHABU|nr:hypothetical protein CBR_g46624 [Chara braunii]|eukprot:GBG88135.1 hypothetical protein CBR_g46624 [Chara braunii]
MGGQQSREEDERDSEEEESSEEEEEEEEEQEDGARKSDLGKGREETDAAMAAAMGGVSLNREVSAQAAKLYRYARNQWKMVDAAAEWKFVRSDDYYEDGVDDPSAAGEGSDRRGGGGLSGGSGDEAGGGCWCLVVKDKFRVPVSTRMNTRYNPEGMRVDFVADGVWALKFVHSSHYEEFVNQLSNSSFENNYKMEATESNFLKVAGKDFVGWLKGEDAEGAPSLESDEEDEPRTPTRATATGMRESGSQAIGGTPRRILVGAGSNSYVLHDGGVDVLRNTEMGMERAGVSFTLTPSGGGGGGGGGRRGTALSSSSFASAAGVPLTPTKGLLMRSERNLLLMSPCKTGPRQATGLHQMDIERGSVVAQWEFKKDDVPIPMREICGDTKSSQLEQSDTFLGLDDNRLCRWDMRVREGLVQELTKPVALDWAEGHTFSRGTNFRCMASTGDGGVAVGSEDGKIRLYGTTSMRQAKTCFPGLGDPITAIDVTFDGRWVLATTNDYLLLIHCLFRDKDGREKTGFAGRMGSQIRAPRLLKLKPEDVSSVMDSGLSSNKVKFRRGQFSWVTESGRQERSIVAAAGNSTVVWDFRRAKQANHPCYANGGEGIKTCYCYKLKKKADMVVESRFMHDNFHGPGSPEAPVVVATPGDLSTFQFH